MARGKKQSLSAEELLEQALVPEDEQPYEVPGNWVWTRLGILSDYIQRGKSPKYSEDQQYPVISQKCIQWDGFDSSVVKFINPESINTYGDERFIQVGDILWNSTGTGTIGRLNIYNNELSEFNRVVADSHVTIVRISKINNNYAYFYLCSPRVQDGIENRATGTTNQIELNTSTVVRMLIPLPPLAEQQRIVDRIESLFAKLDQAKELAQNALVSFETRKAAILHKAFTGELTAKWREDHQHLVNTVLPDIALFANKLSKKNKDLILEAQAVAEPSNIANWYNCTIGAIGTVTNGSTPSRQSEEYWNGDISWVSSGEVRNNVINLTKEKITQLGYDNSSVKLLPVGSVLIAMIGEGKTRGQSAILEIPATTNQNVAAIVIEHGFVSSRFLWYWLQKEYQNNRSRGNGTGPQALNCQRVRELDFIVPPLLEQQEIVRILDNLIEKENQINGLVDVIDQIDLMRKAILARAFRGELGTNDPTEESAFELLKEVVLPQ
ncbi:restriction endonuclease subunit S [Paenibacillus sp. ISL-20]|uniref:restriction endonuclease subunit S n=1 Tax=Paenibacillus sp. ISL-20 TaxID=2819163 RepID=UPI001BEBE4F3|nr:restriction endonuclease subunit S [Paenibacillus sp. ISL-20]MBT2763376.1 restriction endonuclease subunit S [Paenibacillus sp. ISL-20]